jgi:hypothetical protein
MKNKTNKLTSLMNIIVQAKSNSTDKDFNQNLNGNNIANRNNQYMNNTIQQYENKFSIKSLL